jgi:S1-C subfamily serine protease
VTLVRGGKEEVHDMVLKGREGADATASAKTDKALPALGAELASATADEMKALKIENGVKVLRINGGKLRSSGIREGFIITKIDQKPMKNPEDISKALDGKQGGVLIEGIYPNGMRAYYGLGV